MSRLRLTPVLFAAVFALGAGSAVRADDAKCQDGVAKGSRNVGNQEQKKNRACVKDGAGDIDGCVDVESGKAAIQRGKLADLYAPGGKCDPLPALGVGSDPNDIADDTEASAGDILRKVFGDPVDGIAAGDKCQDKIAKRGGKKFDTELKAFRSCIKDAAPVSSQAVIDGCIATGVNDAKAQNTVQPKLQADMASQCTFPVPAGMEDGDCSACTAATTCAACVGNIVDCEACEAMNSSSNSAVNCDLLDDGASNFSCGGCAAAGGQAVGGFCWFLGAIGASCDATCTGMGRTCSPGTISYAGTGGTDAQCQSVLTALGFPGAVSTYGDGSGIGCTVLAPGIFNFPRREVGAPTTCAGLSTNTNPARACACQ